MDDREKLLEIDFEEFWEGYNPPQGILEPEDEPDSSLYREELSSYREIKEIDFESWEKGQ